MSPEEKRSLKALKLNRMRVLDESAEIIPFQDGVTARHAWAGRLVIELNEAPGWPAYL